MDNFSATSYLPKALGLYRQDFLYMTDRSLNFKKNQKCAGEIKEKKNLFTLSIHP